MRIIFLDIDGVLNVIPEAFDRFGGIFHAHFVDNLRTLIKHTDAKIVISSSWRKNSLEEMKQMWHERDLPGEVIDCTPSLYLKKGGSIQFWNNKLSQHPTPKIKGYSIPRGAEIEYWIKNESKHFGEIESYVILDDDTDMLLNQKDNFVQCSNNKNHPDCIDIGYGLTRQCAALAMKILLKNKYKLSFNAECQIKGLVPIKGGIGYNWWDNGAFRLLRQYNIKRENHGLCIKFNYENQTL
jgi:hypothetical protein